MKERFSSDIMRSAEAEKGKWSMIIQFVGSKEDAYLKYELADAVGKKWKNLLGLSDEEMEKCLLPWTEFNQSSIVINKLSETKVRDLQDAIKREFPFTRNFFQIEIASNSDVSKRKRKKWSVTEPRIGSGFAYTEAADSDRDKSTWPENNEPKNESIFRGAVEKGFSNDLYDKRHNKIIKSRGGNSKPERKHIPHKRPSLDDGENKTHI